MSNGDTESSATEPSAPPNETSFLRRVFKSAAGDLNTISLWVGASAAIGVTGYLGFTPLQWLVTGTAAAICLTVAFIRTRKKWKEEGRRAELVKRGLQHQEVVHGRFRVGPYGSSMEDQDAYGRLARLDQDVMVEWIRKSEHAVLFITGPSGVGKTSFIQAYLPPKLAEREVTTILLRSYGDPLEHLRKKLLEKGVVWKSPVRRDRDVFELLSAADDYLESKERALLIVLDQFEELETIEYRDPSRVREISLLLDRFRGASRFKRTKLLLVFRRDYEMSLTRNFSLPAIDLRTNWKLLEPFSEAEASEFLSKNVQDDPELVGALVEQASKAEYERGRIRPITLNMGPSNFFSVNLKFRMS